MGFARGLPPGDDLHGLLEGLPEICLSLFWVSFHYRDDEIRCQMIAGKAKNITAGFLLFYQR
jgi:hypothetical protein